MVASGSLDRVRRASTAKGAAEREYRSAVLAAVAELEAAGAREPFAIVARAAGVSRQAVRELATTAAW